MSQERVAIIDGVRTPFCKMAGAFTTMSAAELGMWAARELLARTAVDPAEIDEVIFGNVAQPPDATNISRVIALLSGIPITTPAFTVQRNCASGLEALTTAALKIQSGQAQCLLVGGVESMSNIPFFLNKDAQDLLSQLGRSKKISEKINVALKLRPKHFAFRVGLMEGLTDPVCGLNMGQTAEVLAKEFGISREAQDLLALRSHQRAVSARALLKEEIVPVIVSAAYTQVVSEDIGPREDQSLAALQKLKPVFDRHTGSITAGNSSQVTDGAAALLVMAESKARHLGLQPLGFVREFAVAGVEPARMGIGPAHAIPRVLKKAGLPWGAIQAFEINEAFAAQVLACVRALASSEFLRQFGYENYGGEIPDAILNPHGGAIALGHPVGATGARLVLTLLKHLQREHLNLGLAALCIGGGQGAAILLER